MKKFNKIRIIIMRFEFNISYFNTILKDVKYIRDEEKSSIFKADLTPT